MITIDQVSKWYGSTQVLKRCSTAVAKGEVVVVCGPSGSGKSTLIKCVNGLEPFQEGTIMVDGISVGDRKTNLSKLRARIGMVFQHFELFPHLTVMRNLELAQVKVLGRDKEESAERGMRLLDRVGLEPGFAARYPSEMSGGQLQRVGIARALAPGPRLIFLDEPTTGLDPRTRMAMWDVIAGLVKGGTTLLLTTQYLEEADQLADRVGIIDHGRIVAEGTPAALKAEVGRPHLDITLAANGGPAPDADAAGRAVAPYGDLCAPAPGVHVSLRVESGAAAMAPVVRALDEAGFTVEGIELVRPTLDDVFFTLTGRSLREAPND